MGVSSEGGGEIESVLTIPFFSGYYFVGDNMSAEVARELAASLVAILRRATRGNQQLLSKEQGRIESILVGHFPPEPVS